MIANQKHLFDVPSPINYLACAANAPILKSAREAGVMSVDRKYHPWDFQSQTATEESETLRGLFAELIGAQTDDVAIVPSTAYGVATAAKNMTLGKGRNVIVLQDQFPSNVYAWQRLADERQGNVVVVPHPRDRDWTAAVLAHMTPETDIVALPPCHWIDGSRLDLSVIGTHCRELGAAFVIDATQAVGAMTIDVDDLQPDYLLCSGYKWLLCPYTISFLYAAPHRQNDSPLEIHGQNKEFGSLPNGGIDYAGGFNVGARRFDMGERNNVINLPMAIAALTQVRSWEPSEIQDTLSLLIDQVAAEARKRGWAVPDDDHRVGHFIGVTPTFPVSDNIISTLAAQNIYVTHRGPGVRVAPHLFTDSNDIDQLFEALDSL